MNRKDYERAALMLRKEYERRMNAVGTAGYGQLPHTIGDFEVEDFLVEFFREDNPKFNEKRFREACLPRCDKMTHRFSDKSCTKHEGHRGKCN
jgi:hypothetical protein